jgi:hypothetical protein
VAPHSRLADIRSAASLVGEAVEFERDAMSALGFTLDKRSLTETGDRYPSFAAEKKRCDH